MSNLKTQSKDLYTSTHFLKTTDLNTLIIDAYNANPTSMQAAIQAFLSAQSADAGRPAMFILGEMRELGDYSQLEHQNIVNMLLEHKENQVLLVGEEYHKTTAPYPIFHDVQALREHLLAHPVTDYRILVKGSRGNQLEKILDVL